MSLSHQALAYLVGRDQCAEILALMTPTQVLIAFLRASGYTDSEIARTLDLASTTVTRTMDALAERIVEELPELRVSLHGRHRCPPPAPENPPPHPPPVLSVPQVAERLHVSPSMVRAWCGQGRFPHAFKGGQTLHAHWEIPEADLDQAGTARDTEAPLCAESGEALPTEGGEALSAAQVARRLRVSVSTVRVWCRKGRFPGATQRRKERGAPWQIPEEDLPTLS